MRAVKAINMSKMKGALLLVVGWLAVATGQFHADTLQDYVTVLDPGTETETAVLPCKLVRDDPSWNSKYAEDLDLRWYKDTPNDPVNPEQAVYLYHERYDGALGYGDERFTRTSNNPEEEYYLRINNATASDQAKYCCCLNNLHSGHRSIACIDLHYKCFDRSKVMFKCDQNSDATEGIPLPATVIAEIRDFYPAEDSAFRQFEIINFADKVTKNSTTNFIEGSNGRYDASLTYTVTEPGAYGFYASLSYEWGNYDEKYIECTYIQDATHVDATKGNTLPPTGQQMEDIEDKDKALLSMIVIGSLSGLLALIVVIIIIIIVVVRRRVCIQGKEVENIEHKSPEASGKHPGKSADQQRMMPPRTPEPEQAQDELAPLQA